MSQVAAQAAATAAFISGGALPPGHALVANPIRTGSRAVPYTPAPRLGAHTTEALREAGLAAAGVTHVVNCATGITNAFPDRFAYLNLELLLPSYRMFYLQSNL